MFTFINKKAFSLTELLIVVWIIWLLMATVLPKIIWWQAKARDTARIWDLLSVSQGLEASNSENNQFPQYNWCLSKTHSTWSWVVKIISKYLKDRIVPTDPVNNAKIWATSLICANWKYFYSPLIKNWFEGTGFILCANVEAYWVANFLSTNLPIGTSGTFWDINSKIWPVLSENDNTANDSLFCIVK